MPHNLMLQQMLSSKNTIFKVLLAENDAIVCVKSAMINENGRSVPQWCCYYVETYAVLIYLFVQLNWCGRRGPLWRSWSWCCPSWWWRGPTSPSVSSSFLFPFVLVLTLGDGQQHHRHRWFDRGNRLGIVLHRNWVWHGRSRRLYNVYKSNLTL